MNLENLHINEITKTDFRTYLILKNNEINWFYWHLSSKLKNLNPFKLTYDNNLVGVLSIEQSSLPNVDLYIEKKYRGMGYGKLFIKKIISDLNEIQFKVSTQNTDSICFFDNLMSERIVLTKKVEKKFIIYRS